MLIGMLGLNDYIGHVFAEVEDDVYVAACIKVIEDFELSKELFGENALNYDAEKDQQMEEFFNCMEEFFNCMAQADYKGAATAWFGYIELDKVVPSEIASAKELDARLEKVHPKLYAKSIKEKII
jgi:hypothetical protein